MGIGRAALGAALVGVYVAQAASGDITLTVDYNSITKATREFTFPRVPPPMKDDLASKAVLKLVDGETDGNSAALNAINDGLWPREEDEPGANYFFNAGTSGGRFRIDLGSVMDVKEVRSYSWHPNTRGPQVYSLYVSDGTDPKFNLSPRSDVKPETVGWTLVTHVDTRMPGDPGGQYAVRIARPGGGVATLGKIRHLLFVCSATEMDDDWGNTFFSEIDVVG